MAVRTFKKRSRFKGSIFLPPGALSSYAQAQRALQTLGLSRPFPSQGCSGLLKGLLQKNLSSVLVGGQKRPWSSPLIRIVSTYPLHSRVPVAPSISVSLHRRIPDGVSKHPCRLLQLPDDMLVKILCGLSHSHLPAVSQTCMELQRTMAEALKVHFNYITPDRPDVDGLPLLSVVPHPKRVQGRIPVSDIFRHIPHPLRATPAGTAHQLPAPRVLFASQLKAPGAHIREGETEEIITIPQQLFHC